MSAAARATRAAAAAAGLASLIGAGSAWADAVVYDDERFVEVPTTIVVRGVQRLGDLTLVVYPYPCALGGAFTELEAALSRDPDARLEGPEEEGRGYLVVREGEAFASASDYEGPLYNCFFFGLPRAEFPEQDGAIARLDGLSDGARWSIFARDPAVLRTGVPLALGGLARRSAAPPREREVAYQARRVDGRLEVAAVKWTWTQADGTSKAEDPRKLSSRRLLAVEPHADRSDDEEAAWFAGALARAARPGEAPEMNETTGSEGHVDGAAPGSAVAAAGSTGPERQAVPAALEEVPAETGPKEQVTPAAEPGPPVSEAGPPAEEAAAEVGSGEEGAWDRGWLYGVACLVIAAGAGLLLRRGRG